MANPYFSFKQFTVYQDRCAMKVGVDGVLLGVWTNVNNTNQILDIGTGTGLIAIMLAQRNNSMIDAIEIDSKAVIQASENIKLSPWASRIKVTEISLQDFARSSNKRYDLIVSNPPYFVNSLKSPSGERTLARHADTLTHEELIINALILLKPTGRLSVILPVKEALQCQDFAFSKGLFCIRQVNVIPKPNALAKRVLLEFSLQHFQKEVSELVTEGEQRHEYSKEFSLLAKEFYLKL